MIDSPSLQTELKAATWYAGQVDGIFGPATRAARDNAVRAYVGSPYDQWPEPRREIAAAQWVFRRHKLPVGAIDGVAGPNTLYALELWQNALRDKPGPDVESIWPRQKDMARFYGTPGTNHVLLDLPYPMRLAWDTGTVVKRITINSKCAESAGRALSAALDHYGYDRIVALGLDLFGGCYENRKMRGGSALSTHAFACALDINPLANQLRWTSARAAMAKADCAAFLDAWEKEGWISLGRARNYDWMHIQAARL